MNVGSFLPSYENESKTGTEWKKDWRSRKQGFEKTGRMLIRRQKTNSDKATKSMSLQAELSQRSESIQPNDQMSEKMKQQKKSFNAICTNGTREEADQRRILK